MTVIAYKYPYIVADQRVTITTGLVLGTMNKLRTHTKDNKTLYLGAAGCAGHIDTLFKYVLYDMEYIEKNDEAMKELRDILLPDPKGEGKMDGLVIEVIDGVPVYYCYDDDLSRIQIKHPYYAEGSGMRVALGALYMGADAFDAVAAATHLDVACGFPVSGYNVLNGKSYEFLSQAELDAWHEPQQLKLL